MHDLSVGVAGSRYVYIDVGVIVGKRVGQRGLATSRGPVLAGRFRLVVARSRVFLLVRLGGLH